MADRLEPETAPIAGSAPQLGERHGEGKPALSRYPPPSDPAVPPGGTLLRIGMAPSVISMSANGGPGLAAVTGEAERRFSSSLSSMVLCASLTADKYKYAVAVF